MRRSMRSSLDESSGDETARVESSDWETDDWRPLRPPSRSYQSDVDAFPWKEGDESPDEKEAEAPDDVPQEGGEAPSPPLARLPLCQACEPPTPLLYAGADEQLRHAAAHARVKGAPVELSACFPLLPTHRLRRAFLPRIPGLKRRRWDEDDEYEESGTESHADPDEFQEDSELTDEEPEPLLSRMRRSRFERSPTDSDEINSDEEDILVETARNFLHRPQRDRRPKQKFAIEEREVRTPSKSSASIFKAIEVEGGSETTPTSAQAHPITKEVISISRRRTTDKCNLCHGAKAPVEVKFAAHVWKMHVRRALWRCPKPTCTVSSNYEPQIIERHIKHAHPEMVGAALIDERAQHMGMFRRLFSAAFNPGLEDERRDDELLVSAATAAIASVIQEPRETSGPSIVVQPKVGEELSFTFAEGPVLGAVADPIPDIQVAPLVSSSGGNLRRLPGRVTECQICRTFTSSSFTRHVWEKHIPLPWVLHCPVCPFTQPSPVPFDRRAMSIHIQTQHQTTAAPADQSAQYENKAAELLEVCFPRKYPAPVTAQNDQQATGGMPQAWNSQPSTRISKSSYRPKQCTQCNEKMTGSAARHVWEKHIGMDWVQRCPHCNFYISTRIKMDLRKMRAHMRDVHSSANCPIDNSTPEIRTQARRLLQLCFPSEGADGPSPTPGGGGERCLQCGPIREPNAVAHVLAAHMQNTPVITCPLTSCMQFHAYDLEAVKAHIRAEHPEIASSAVPIDKRPYLQEKVNQLVRRFFVSETAAKKAAKSATQRLQSRTILGICYVCGMQMERKYQLNHYKKMHAGMKVQWLDLPGVSEKDGERLGKKFVACALCHEKVRRARKGLHILRNHSGELGPEVAWECPWDACPFYHATKQGVEDHQTECTKKSPEFRMSLWSEDSALLRLTQMHDLLFRCFGDEKPRSVDDQPKVAELPVMARTVEGSGRLVWERVGAAAAPAKQRPPSPVTHVLSNCRLCGQYTPSDDNSHRRHVTAAHMQQGVWACPACPLRAHVPSQISLHIQSQLCYDRRCGAPCRPSTHPHCGVNVVPEDLSTAYAHLIADKIAACFHRSREGPREEVPSPIVTRAPPVASQVRPQPPIVAEANTSGPPGDIIQCARCQQKLHTSRQIDHIVDRHISFDLVVCPLCEVSMKWNVGDMLRHMQDMHTEHLAADPDITPIRRDGNNIVQNLHRDCFPGLPCPDLEPPRPGLQQIEIAAGSPASSSSGGRRHESGDAVPESEVAPMLPPASGRADQGAAQEPRPKPHCPVRYGCPNKGCKKRYTSSDAMDFHAPRCFFGQQKVLVAAPAPPVSGGVSMEAEAVDAVSLMEEDSPPNAPEVELIDIEPDFVIPSSQTSGYRLVQPPPPQQQRMRAPPASSSGWRFRPIQNSAQTTFAINAGPRFPGPRPIASVQYPSTSAAASFGSARTRGPEAVFEEFAPPPTPTMEIPHLDRPPPTPDAPPRPTPRPTYAHNYAVSQTPIRPRPQPQIQYIIRPPTRVIRPQAPPPNHNPYSAYQPYRFPQ